MSGVPSRSTLGAPLRLNHEARIRLRHLVARAAGTIPPHLDIDAMLLDMATWVLKQTGVDLVDAHVLRLDDMFEARSLPIYGGSALSFFLAGLWYALQHHVDPHGRGYRLMPPDEYEAVLNLILSEEGVSFRLRAGA